MSNVLLSIFCDIPVINSPESPMSGALSVMDDATSLMDGAGCPMDGTMSVMFETDCLMDGA